MTRLYVTQTLDTNLTLSLEQSHYVVNVLRHKAGDTLTVFNGKDGEFSFQIQEITKKGIFCKAIECLRPFEALPPLTLMFAPIKQVDWMIEKATEIGVTHFMPVITDHCHVRKLNFVRLRRISIEASEQCERLCVPEFSPLILLKEASYDTPILFAYERLEKGEHTDYPNFDTVLIGPEGGFSPDEVQFLLQKCTPMSLGKTILRAETAAIVALDRVRSSR